MVFRVLKRRSWKSLFTLTCLLGTLAQILCTTLLVPLSPAGSGVLHWWDARTRSAQAAPVAQASLRPPPIRAKSAYVLDANTGAALFQKFPNSRRAMASTTKTMTGLLAAESGRLDEFVVVGRDAATVGETTMGLEEGEQIPLRDLLYGLMMNSGNDAAIAIAEHLAGSVPAFVDQMNARAAQLGLADTRFTNPHGLDHWKYASPNLYASARDLAVLGAAALSNPILHEVVRTQQREVWGSKGAHRLRHTVSALWWYPGAIGVKTGWTERAGHVRIVGAERAGKRLVAVVMHSPDDVQEIRELLDYAFALSGVSEPRERVPVNAEALPQPAPKLTQAWETYKRLAVTGEGRVRSGADGTDASSDAQAPALLQAVWFRDRATFDALWGWTNLALSRRQDRPEGTRRDYLYASRWSRGNVTDWNNSTAADQRIAAALLFASKLWQEPAYADAAGKILEDVLNHAAISWDVAGVPAAGWSIPAANSFLKDLEPVTTSAATLTPAFYRMFAEATRRSIWLWMLDGTYAVLQRSSASEGSLGGNAATLPGWFSVSRTGGRVGQPIDPTWQSAGFSWESTQLAWQLSLEAAWAGEPRAEALLQPVAQLLARDLAQRQRIAAAYSRSGSPLGMTETTAYGALAGVALVQPGAEAAMRGKIDASLASNHPERILDGIQGLWLLEGGPPNFWRIWHPPADLPTTRNDAVVPPGDGYPWRYYEETGHTVHGPLFEYFRANGAVELFGYPRTEAFVEEGRTVQYFQRGRLELVPGDSAPGLAALGRLAAESRGVLKGPAAQPVDAFSDEERLYFPETGHSVSRGFKKFLEANGGVAVLGLPLTEEFTEDGFTVQYFERTVLEYQPGRPIQATLLGDSLLKEKGWLK
ncbi:MAG TPA: glycosyl hydrolase family 8 [Chloroflexota bacterium]|nr:glycosyl hydrolase family 8 [Chloroflexota bacterium]